MILLRRRQRPIQMLSTKLDISTLEMMELTNRMRDIIIKANGNTTITSGEGRLHVSARG